MVPRSTAATRTTEPMLPPGLWLGLRAVAAARRIVRRADPILQIGLVIGLAEVYRLLRRLIPTDWPVAIANAHHVLHLERALHLDWETGAQRVFLHAPELVKGMNWFYLSSHFVVTGAFFVWLYWRDREGFAIFRDAVQQGVPKPPSP